MKFPSSRPIPYHGMRLVIFLALSVLLCDSVGFAKSLVTVATTPTVTAIDLVGTPGADATTVNFTVSFSESVKNVSTGDFVVTDVSGSVSTNISNVSSATGTSMTVTVNNIDGTGTIRLDLRASNNITKADDTGSVAAFTGGETHDADTDPPSATGITLVGSPSSSANTVNYSVNFDEPVVNLSTNDFEIVKTGSANASIASVSASSGSSITVGVESISGTGSIRVNLKNSTNIDDNAGNAISSGFTGELHTVDNPPVVTGITVVGSPGSSVTTVDFLVSFDEQALNLSIDDFELALDELEVVAALASVSSTSGTSVVVTIDNIFGIGPVGINLKANTNIQDTEGNGNGVNGFTSAFTSGETHQVDNTGPSDYTVTLSPTVINTSTPGGTVLKFTFGGAEIGASGVYSISSSGGGSFTKELNNSSGDNEIISTNQEQVFPSEIQTGLSEGTITLEVTLTDATGNTGKKVTDVILKDLTNPGAPAPNLADESDRGSSNTDNITSDNTPTFNGTTEPNSTVVIRADGTILNPSTPINANASGEWNFSSTSLGDGDYDITIVATDPAGNTSTEMNALSITIDTDAPSAPTLDLSSGSDTGVMGDGITSATLLTFTGTADPGATVEVLLASDESLGTTSADLSTGIWSITSGVTLDPDSYTVAAVATSLAGEESEQTTLDIIINTSTPTVSISSSESSPTNADPIPITVTFLEAVVGFEQSDIEVTGGTINNFTGTGASYSFNLAPTSNGQLTVNIGQGVATDLAGNTNSSAEEFFITSDKAPSTVVISSVLSSPTNSNPIPVGVVFSEPVTGFDIGDLVVSEGSSVNNFDGTGTSYTFDLIPSINGVFTVDVAANAASDAAGNGNTGSNTFSINYSTTAPQITITADNVVGSATNDSPIPIRVNFSLPVTGFEAMDLIVSGGTVSDFIGSATEYTFNLTPSSEGELTINIPAGAAEDEADNPNIPAPPYSISFDTTAPSVIVGSTDADPTNSERIPFTVIFSEPVTGFTGESLIISGDPLITEFEGSGSNYSFNVTPSEDGNITVKIDENAASDAAGNSNIASNQYTINYDITPPGVTIKSSLNNPTNSRSIPVTITFTEPVFGFTVADLEVSGGTLDNFAGAESIYTFEIRPPSNGEVTVDIDATVAFDEAGNPNNAASQFSIDYDQTLPSGIISTEITSPTRTMVIPVLVTFSEEVVGFEVEDLDVSGGSVSNFVSGEEIGTYSFDLTPTTDGQVIVSIASSAADDQAGNGNTSITPLSITYDATTPTGVITSTAPALTNSSPIPLQVTFSEAVTDFLGSSVKVSGGSLTNFSGFGTIYTFDVEPSGDGDITVNLSRSSFFDLVGNPNTETAAFVIEYDATAPTASVSSNTSSPTNISPIPMTATFSEPVTGFGVGDLKIVGGVVSNLSGSGTDYAFNLIPNGDGEITVEVALGGASDEAGNGNIASPQYSIVFDAASSPIPTIASTSSNPTNASLIPVTVTFNEQVTGFDASDLQVAGGSVSNFTGTGASYGFDLIPSGSGIITVDIPSSATVDNIGNESVTATRFSITYDSSAPATVISSTATSPINAGPIPIQVTFNEVVTGFNADDLIIIGGSTSNFLGSGTTYTFDLVPVSDGPLTVSIPAGIASDALGNENSAAQDFSIIYDATSPTVSISSLTSSPTGISPILMTVTFSEQVNGFTIDDLSITGGEVSSFGGSGTVYTFNLSPTSTGELTVEIAANAARDEAGNQSVASNQFSIVYDVSNAAEITSFSVSESTVAANIGEGTVMFEVEDGTDVTALVPTITISDNATISPLSGTPQDFREPVTYTVTAENRTTVQVWTVSLVNGTVLGIDLQEIISIYPNPVQDRLLIPLSHFNGEALTMMITDLSGKVTERRTIVGSSELMLDVHDYHPGMYVLRIEHGEKRFSTRFIKK